VDEPERAVALFAIGVGLSLLAYFARKHRDERKRRVLVGDALKERGRRAEALAWLRAKEHQLRARRRRAIGPLGILVWRDAYDGQLFETQADMAELLLSDDRNEEALAVLVDTESYKLVDDPYAERAELLFEARLALGRWEEAERTFEQYPLVDDDVKRDGRARVRLGRNDVQGALDELGEPRLDDELALQLTRARALAMAQRQPEEVERILTAQPRVELETFARRHPDEAAAVVVRRLLDATGPYR
jgi:hypothetical protein